jgi:RES domain-containing protein
VLCSYEVDCAPIADLRSDAGCRRHHARLAERTGCTGLLTPNFAPRATPRDHNLVLRTWGPELPTRVAVNDPSGRLPSNQLSWPT